MFNELAMLAGRFKWVIVLFAVLAGVTTWALSNFKTMLEINEKLHAQATPPPGIPSKPPAAPENRDVRQEPGRLGGNGQPKKKPATQTAPPARVDSGTGHANTITEEAVNRPRSNEPLTQPVVEHMTTVSCSQERTVRSSDKTPPISMSVSNGSHEGIQVYWLGYEGTRSKYLDLAPGGSSPISTFLGHAWLIADAKDQHCLGIFVATADGARLDWN